MARKVKKPKEDLAPSYFVQYSALWCVLLGFFVMLLSLGHSRMGPGAEGLGDVRDAFGSTGGLGLLSFAKNVMFGKNDGGSSSFRIRQNTPSQPAEMDGYIRGLLKKQGLSGISNIVLVRSDNGLKVVIKVPVSFQGSDQLDQDSVKLLEQLAEVLVGLHTCNVEVMAVSDQGANQEEGQRKAMLRAAVVARLLTDAEALEPDHVQAVGYCDTRFVDRYGMKPVKGCVFISIQQGER